jgi:hypothetical protein
MEKEIGSLFFRINIATWNARARAIPELVAE